jgi:hypothetical protein
MTLVRDRPGIVVKETLPSRGLSAFHRQVRRPPSSAGVTAPVQIPVTWGPNADGHRPEPWLSGWPGGGATGAAPVGLGDVIARAVAPHCYCGLGSRQSGIQSPSLRRSELDFPRPSSAFLRPSSSGPHKLARAGGQGCRGVWLRNARCPLGTDAVHWRIRARPFGAKIGGRRPGRQVAGAISRSGTRPPG